MAKYPSMVITKEGLSMIAESQGGQGLIFTKVTLGAGDLNGGSIINLTDLIDNRINANITAIDATSRPGQVTLTAVVSNSEVDAGFHAKEIGVFAKIGEGGTERLYAYTNAGNYADYMPDKTDPVNETIFKTTFVVSNAQNIQAVIDKSIVYPTVLEMDTAIKKHNEAEDAHETVFNCYVKSVTEKKRHSNRHQRRWEQYNV
ncbi:MAG TPA: phage tail protein [Phascolarctobacterium faecium]|uniref:phage tail-collar fiber domain-containing protein n=1 Tax=Phascolarctobacterium faecium TaxID=33025 RepID=UPI00242DA5DC|nr:phage tail protein [Phascolarctobacterium faecium]HJI08929.1 phage tail protein [Phascolarctobacterium faecium]